MNEKEALERAKRAIQSDGLSRDANGVWWQTQQDQRIAAAIMEAYACKPMDTAPKDHQILVLARWDWDGSGYPDEDYAFRVAQFREDYPDGPKAFWSITSHPYKDLAVDPIGWSSLPKMPTSAAHSAAADTLSVAEA
jgi:hypothetical protein